MPDLTDENARFVREYKSPLIVRPVSDDGGGREWTPTSKRTGVLVKKIGVQPQWLNDGRRILCTLLEVLDNHVISYLSPDQWYSQSIVGKRKAFNRHGEFGRLTVGAVTADPTKVLACFKASIYTPLQLTAEYMAQFSHAGVPPKEHLASFMVTHDARLHPGTPLSIGHFRVGEYVDVTGRT